MAISRISSTEPLRDDEATSWAPAVARRLATSLAGRARYLLELIRGDDCGFDGDSGTPLNPQGQPGIDRSGPPWGTAHTHPLWIYEYKDSADINGATPLGYTMNAVGQQITIYPEFPVRPFFVFDGAPYSRAYLRWRITKTAGTGSVTVLARIYPAGSDEQTTPSASITTSSSTTSTGIAYGDIQPGINNLRIVLEAITVPSGCTIRIDAMSLNQIEARSH